MCGYHESVAKSKLLVVGTNLIVHRYEDLEVPERNWFLTWLGSF